MPWHEVVEELRELPGEQLPAPTIEMPEEVVARIQQRLLEQPGHVNAVLFKVAATEHGSNAGVYVRMESGWTAKAWVGTVGWQDPTLTWGVEVEKVWTW